mmetsp:Transcript_1316/g.3339  ORF Transcript_1316/g.3339 Transcript_1316/m.3339 type:complete len:842 (+) Transcript_1316:261-2786(+)
MPPISPSTAFFSESVGRDHRMESRRDPAIRHSGRAHIRGKIRRVWRPRYLELCDSGFVRYYELPPLADITMPEEADWQHINMVIKDTLIIHHARIIDVTTLRDLHVGLPRGSYGFLFRGQRVGGHLSNNNFEVDQNTFVDMQHDRVGQSCSTNSVVKEMNPPREYFCAVGTLEEAQSWVIALQWAVKVCQKTLQQLDSKYENDEEKIDDWNKDIGDTIRGNNLEKKKATQVITRKGTNHKRSKSGRILVTNVSDYRIIRVASLFRWDVAYEVALLLIENNKERVEERRILLTVEQLDAMLRALSKSLPNRASLLDDLRRQTGKLTRFQYADGGTAGRCSGNMIDSSMTTLKGILRALAMEAAAVNSRSMRHLFGLDVERPKIQEVQWWNSQTSGKKLDAGSSAPVLFRQVRSIPSSLKVDDYVRRWLAQPPKLLSSREKTSRIYLETQIWFLQRPFFLMGGLGLVLTMVYPVSQAYPSSMINISIRMDVLLLTWGIAFCAGQQKGRTTQQIKARHHPSSLGATRSSASRAQTTNTHKNRNNQNSIATCDTVTSTVATEEDDITAQSLDESNCDDGEELDYLDEEEDTDENLNVGKLSSPIPKYPDNDGLSCWSEPADPAIFHVRGRTYLEDRVKVPSGRSPFKCRGVDLWLTDNPERYIARHPSVLGGKLNEEDTFLINFLLPFGNFVAYFSVPPLSEFPNKEVANVWSSFVDGDQQYRDARLKLLPIVIDGPWIVKAAVGNGKSPALLGKVIPLQYYFRKPEGTKKGIYEVDVIITASSIAKGILSVVKGHAKSLSIAFGLIIEAAKEEELPETVLSSFQIHALNLNDCPRLPDHNLETR